MQRAGQETTSAVSANAFSEFAIGRLSPMLERFSYPWTWDIVYVTLDIRLRKFCSDSSREYLVWKGGSGVSTLNQISVFLNLHTAATVFVPALPIDAVTPYPRHRTSLAPMVSKQVGIGSDC